MKRHVEVTRGNLHHIDFDSIAAFSYAEDGAMGGDAGTLTFSTADGTSCRLDFSRGPVKPGEFCRVYHDGSLTATPIPSLTWKHLYLGEGNHFLAHEIVVNKLLYEGQDNPEQIYLSGQYQARPTIFGE